MDYVKKEMCESWEEHREEIEEAWKREELGCEGCRYEIDCRAFKQHIYPGEL